MLLVELQYEMRGLGIKNKNNMAFTYKISPPPKKKTLPQPCHFQANFLIASQARLNQAIDVTLGTKTSLFIQKIQQKWQRVSTA